MKLTINEIAEMAHVAKSTVSKAINGQKGVSESNRQRILEIIHQVNFQPNVSARALAQNRTSAIGIVLPHSVTSLSGTFWATVVSAVAAEANRHNNSLMVISPQEGEKLKLETLEAIVNRHCVDGLIIGAEQVQSQTIMNVLLQDIPFVFIGKNQFLDHYAVDVTNRKSALNVTEQLIARGYKKIGCIAGPENFKYIKERVQGFKDALEKAGLDSSIITYSDYKKESAVKAASAFFEQHKDIDALFLAAGGEFVLNVIEALKSSGRDLKSIGLGVFDDSRIFDFLDWSIVAARQPVENMAQCAAAMLFDIINGNPPEKKYNCFDAEIIQH